MEENLQYPQVPVWKDLLLKPEQSHHPRIASTLVNFLQKRSLWLKFNLDVLAQGNLPAELIILLQSDVEQHVPVPNN